MDLRERAVAACDRGDATRQQIAEWFIRRQEGGNCWARGNFPDRQPGTPEDQGGFVERPCPSAPFTGLYAPPRELSRPLMLSELAYHKSLARQEFPAQ